MSFTLWQTILTTNFHKLNKYHGESSTVSLLVPHSVTNTEISSPIISTDYKPHPIETMKAAQWMGPRDIQLGTVPKPMLTANKDAIVHITHCTICGSDLHMYNPDMKSAMEKGLILGHEAIGIVDEVGPEVKTLQVGDRVIILPVIACGECFYCQNEEYSLCDKTNPSKEMEQLYGHRLSGIFGYSNLTGGYPGSQAEWCRVPNADLVCVKAPKDIAAKKLLGLCDVTPTAWHGNELAEVGKGDVVGVWGCGAVGLSIQRLALLRGAKKVYAIDKDPYRLALAERYGSIPLDVSDYTNIADLVLELEPHGLDRAIEASGFRSTNSIKHKIMRGINAEGDSAMMEKALTVRGGQLYAQKYFPLLLDLTTSGNYDPSFMFTYEDDFENVAVDYEKFNNHEVPGGLKVCLVTAFGRSQK
ncbi:putative Zinc-type alcohol dehydrogenase-like protein [Glarea lozoyensis 74030]|uniref:Putative Zinc-type alcohol dehydrogenase-like protein n=1 Tax=Glarea lozoyensis (strain ATCC 74030 / MF5533) TaxID=1104152 RepID=H0EXZ3_GLAL7|nr:putative Zinc-type alcohol dehydrogenase-like protein [Glarea lozoyensis 74030]